MNENIEERLSMAEEQVYALESRMKALETLLFVRRHIGIEIDERGLEDDLRAH